MGFGRADRRVRGLAEQGDDRDDTALTRAQPVQQDLVTVRPALRGADQSFHEEGIVGARASIAEQSPAGGGLHELGGLHDPPEQLWRKAVEHRVAVNQVFAFGRVHAALPRVRAGSTRDAPTARQSARTRPACADSSIRIAP